MASGESLEPRELQEPTGEVASVWGVHRGVGFQLGTEDKGKEA